MKKFISFILLTFVISGSAYSKSATIINAENILTRFYKKEYLNLYKVSVSNYESSGDKSGKPISNAFDNDWLYVWQSQTNSGEQSITVTFDTETSISKIIYGLRDRNPFPSGDGYPQTIKIFSSQSDSGNDFEHKTTVTSNWSADKLLLCLPEPISGRRIKLVFEDIYNTMGTYGGYAEIAELMFLKSDPVFDDVVRMFEDEKQMVLTPYYKDDQLLDSLETEALNHNIASNYLVERIRHAKNILKNKLEPDSYPFPVEIIQKTGPDSEKYVMLFLPDRFTVSELDNFISTVKSDTEVFFSFEPYKSLRNEFNVYAVMIPSNMGGSAYNTTDSYFSTYLGASGDGGNPRVGTFTSDGREMADSTIMDFTKRYLDKDGFVHCANFLMNTASYGGAGQNFCNGATRGCTYTTNAGSYVLVHETGHAIGRLGDEYCYILTTEAVNLTKESNGENSKWKEFLKFRNVRHIHMCDGVYKPTGTCMMYDSYGGWKFCELCKLGLFCYINDSIANKKDWYIADPIIYANYTNLVPTEVKKENITIGNNQQLQFRSVIKNMSQTGKTVTAEFKITNATESIVRTICTNEIYIPAQEIKSVTATTDGVVTGLVDGDKIFARIIEKESGRELVDYNTYKDNFGTVMFRYLLGNRDETTNIRIENINDSYINYPAGSELEIEPLNLKNHTYQSSNKTGKITINRGTTTLIDHYYTRDKGLITLRLLDENNNELQTIERYIEYGEAFVPSQTDFKAREGYSVILPTNVATFDGINDMELTYKLTKEPLSIEDSSIDNRNGIIVLFPNPNDGNFSVKIDNAHIGEVEITCVTTEGKVLRKFTTEKESENIIIPMNITEYNGLVIINIRCGNISQTASVIIR